MKAILASFIKQPTTEAHTTLTALQQMLSEQAKALNLLDGDYTSLIKKILLDGMQINYRKEQ